MKNKLDTLHFAANHKILLGLLSLMAPGLSDSAAAIKMLFDGVADATELPKGCLEQVLQDIVETSARETIEQINRSSGRDYLKIFSEYFQAQVSEGKFDLEVLVMDVNAKVETSQTPPELSELMRLFTQQFEKKLAHCREASHYITALRMEKLQKSILNLSKQIAEIGKESGGTPFYSYIHQVAKAVKVPKWEATQFQYDAEQVSFFGYRDKLKQLEDFCADSRPFLWWAVTGQGGMGKSRLAYEFARRNDEESWTKIFIKWDDGIPNLENSPWEYKNNLFLILDNALLHVAEIGKWFEKLVEVDASKSTRLRILLLEREPFCQKSKPPLWARYLSREEPKILSERYCFKYPIMDLDCLTDEDYLLIAEDYLWRNYRKKVPLETIETEILKPFYQMEKEWKRPLYLLLTADTWVSDRKALSNWDRKTALKSAYQKERNRLDSILKGYSYSEGAEDLCCLLTFATAVGGLDCEREEGIPEFLMESYQSLKHSKRNLHNIKEIFSAVNLSSESPLKLRPLKPDILGEFFCLQFLSDMQQDFLKDFTIAGWEIDFRNYWNFMLCMVNDFGEESHPVPDVLLIFPKNQSADRLKNAFLSICEMILRKNLYSTEGLNAILRNIMLNISMDDDIIREAYKSVLVKLIHQQKLVDAEKTFSELKKFCDDASSGTIKRDEKYLEGLRVLEKKGKDPNSELKQEYEQYLTKNPGMYSPYFHQFLRNITETSVELASKQDVIAAMSTMSTPMMYYDRYIKNYYLDDAFFTWIKKFPALYGTNYLGALIDLADRYNIVGPCLKALVLGLNTWLWKLPLPESVNRLDALCWPAASIDQNYFSLPIGSLTATILLKIAMEEDGVFTPEIADKVKKYLDLINANWYSEKDKFTQRFSDKAKEAGSAAASGMCRLVESLSENGCAKLAEAVLNSYVSLIALEDTREYSLSFLRNCCFRLTDPQSPLCMFGKDVSFSVLSYAEALFELIKKYIRTEDHLAELLHLYRSDIGGICSVYCAQALELEIQRRSPKDAMMLLKPLEEIYTKSHSEEIELAYLKGIYGIVNKSNFFDESWCMDWLRKMKKPQSSQSKEYCWQISREMIKKVSFSQCPELLWNFEKWLIMSDPQDLEHWRSFKGKIGQELQYKAIDNLNLLILQESVEMCIMLEEFLPVYEKIAFAIENREYVEQYISKSINVLLLHICTDDVKQSLLQIISPSEKGLAVYVAKRGNLLKRLIYMYEKLPVMSIEWFELDWYEKPQPFTAVLQQLFHLIYCFPYYHLFRRIYKDDIKVRLFRPIIAMLASSREFNSPSETNVILEIMKQKPKYLSHWNEFDVMKILSEYYDRNPERVSETALCLLQRDIQLSGQDDLRYFRAILSIKQISYSQKREILYKFGIDCSLSLQERGIWLRDLCFEDALELAKQMQAVCRSGGQFAVNAAQVAALTVGRLQSNEERELLLLLDDTASLMGEQEVDILLLGIEVVTETIPFQELTQAAASFDLLMERIVPSHDKLRQLLKANHLYFQVYPLISRAYHLLDKIAGRQDPLSLISSKAIFMKEPRMWRYIMKEHESLYIEELKIQLDNTNEPKKIAFYLKRYSIPLDYEELHICKKILMVLENLYQKYWNTSNGNVYTHSFFSGMARMVIRIDGANRKDMADKIIQSNLNEYQMSDLAVSFADYAKECNYEQAEQFADILYAVGQPLHYESFLLAYASVLEYQISLSGPEKWERLLSKLEQLYKRFLRKPNRSRISETFASALQTVLKTSKTEEETDQLLEQLKHLWLDVSGEQYEEHLAEIYALAILKQMAFKNQKDRQALFLEIKRLLINGSTIYRSDLLAKAFHLCQNKSPLLTVPIST